MNRPELEQVVGFECGGNGQRLFHGLIGNATWRGTALQSLLQEAGIQSGAKEVVFLAPILAPRKFAVGKWRSLSPAACRFPMPCDRKTCWPGP